jgi:hypothetical protein
MSYLFENIFLISMSLTYLGRSCVFSFEILETFIILIILSVFFFILFVAISLTNDVTIPPWTLIPMTRIINVILDETKIAADKLSSTKRFLFLALKKYNKKQQRRRHKTALKMIKMEELKARNALIRSARILGQERRDQALLAKRAKKAMKRELARKSSNIFSSLGFSTFSKNEIEHRVSSRNTRSKKRRSLPYIRLAGKLSAELALEKYTSSATSTLPSPSSILVVSSVSPGFESSVAIPSEKKEVKTLDTLSPVFDLSLSQILVFIVSFFNFFISLVSFLISNVVTLNRCVSATLECHHYFSNGVMAKALLLSRLKRKMRKKQKRLKTKKSNFLNEGMCANKALIDAGSILCASRKKAGIVTEFQLLISLLPGSSLSDIVAALVASNASVMEFSLSVFFLGKFYAVPLPKNISSLPGLVVSLVMSLDVNDDNTGHITFSSEICKEGISLPSIPGYLLSLSLYGGRGRGSSLKRVREDAEDEDEEEEEEEENAEEENEEEEEEEDTEENMSIGTSSHGSTSSEKEDDEKEEFIPSKTQSRYFWDSLYVPILKLVSDIKKQVVDIGDIVPPAPHIGPLTTCIECLRQVSDSTGVTSTHGESIGGVSTLNANAVNSRIGWQLAVLVVTMLMEELFIPSDIDSVDIIEKIKTNPPAFFTQCLILLKEYVHTKFPAKTKAEKKAKKPSPDYGLLTPLVPYLQAFATAPKDTKKKGLFDLRAYSVVPPAFRTLSRVRHLMENVSKAIEEAANSISDNDEDDFYQLPATPDRIIIILNPMHDGASLEKSFPKQFTSALKDVLAPLSHVIDTSLLPFSGFLRASTLAANEADARLLEQSAARSNEQHPFPSDGTCHRHDHATSPFSLNKASSMDEALRISCRGHFCQNSSSNNFLVPYWKPADEVSLDMVDEDAAAAPPNIADTVTPKSIAFKHMALCRIENGPYEDFFQKQAKKSKKEKAREDALSDAQKANLCLSGINPFKLGCAPTSFCVDKDMNLFTRTLFPHTVSLFSSIVEEFAKEYDLTDGIVSIVCATYGAEFMLAEQGLAGKIDSFKHIRVQSSPSCGKLAKGVVTNQVTMIKDFADVLKITISFAVLKETFDKQPKLWDIKPIDFTCANGALSFLGHWATNERGGYSPTDLAVVSQSSVIGALARVPVFVTGEDKKEPNKTSRRVTVGTEFTSTPSQHWLTDLNSNGVTSMTDAIFSTASTMDDGNASTKFGNYSTVNGVTSFIPAPIPKAITTEITSTPIPVLVRVSINHASAGGDTAKTNALLGKGGKFAAMKFWLKAFTLADLPEPSEDVMKALATSLDIPYNLLMARLTTHEYSNQRILNGQTLAMSVIQAFVSCFTIAYKLPCKSTGLNAASSSSTSLPPPSSSSSSSAAASASASSSSSKYIYAVSRHGDGRLIEGLPAGYESFPIIGSIDRAISKALWAFGAGDWDLLKKTLASAENIETVVSSRDVRNTTTSSTQVHEDADNATTDSMLTVVTAQFGRTRKILDGSKKGSMKMWLDEQSKPKSEKEFRILLVKFDEEFTNSTSTPPPPPVKKAVSKDIEVSGDNTVNVPPPPPSPLYTKLLSRSATTLEWPIHPDIKKFSGSDFSKALMVGILMAPPSLAAFLTVYGMHHFNFKFGKQHKGPMNRVLESFSSQVDAENRKNTAAGKAALGKTEKESLGGGSREESNAVFQKASDDSAAKQVGNDTFQTRNYAQGRYTLPLYPGQRDTASMSNNMVELMTGEIVRTGRRVNADQTPTTRCVVQFHIDYIPRTFGHVLIGKKVFLQRNANAHVLFHSSNSSMRLQLPESIEAISTLDAFGTGAIVNFAVASGKYHPGGPPPSVWGDLKRKNAGGPSEEEVNRIKVSKEDILQRFHHLRAEAIRLGFTPEQCNKLLRNHKLFKNLPDDYFRVGPLTCAGCKTKFSSDTDPNEFYMCEAPTCLYKNDFFCLDCFNLATSDTIMSKTTSTSSSSSSSSSLSSLSSSSSSSTKTSSKQINLDDIAHGELLCNLGATCIDHISGCHKSTETEANKDSHSYICASCISWNGTDILQTSTLEARAAMRQAIVDANATPQTIILEEEDMKRLQSALKFKGKEKEQKKETLKNAYEFDKLVFKFFPYTHVLSIDEGILQFVSAIMYDAKANTSKLSSTSVSLLSNQSTATSASAPAASAPATTTTFSSSSTTLNANTSIEEGDTSMKDDGPIISSSSTRKGKKVRNSGVNPSAKASSTSISAPVITNPAATSTTSMFQSGSSSSALQHSSSTSTSTSTSKAPIYDFAHALYSIQVLRGVVGTEADINEEGRKGAKIKNPSRPHSKSSSTTSNTSSSSSSSSSLEHQPSVGDLVKLAKIVWMVDSTPHPERLLLLLKLFTAGGSSATSTSSAASSSSSAASATEAASGSYSTFADFRQELSKLTNEKQRKSLLGNLTQKLKELRKTAGTISSVPVPVPVPVAFPENLKQKSFQDRLLMAKPITDAVKREGSLLKRIFKMKMANAEKPETPSGHGDKIFSTTVPIRPVDAAQQLIRLRIVELTKPRIEPEEIEEDDDESDTDSVRNHEEEAVNMKEEEEEDATLVADPPPSTTSSSSSSSSSSRPRPQHLPLSLPQIRAKREKAEETVTTAIAAERDKTVLKAAAAVLAARRRQLFIKATRRSIGEAQRTATSLCRQVGVGGTMILPPVDVAAWLKSVNPSTAGYAQTLGLGRFINMLHMTAARYNITIVGMNEPFTSRECSNCRDCIFRGSGRTFSCSVCGLTTHRDAGNSASNIMYRAVALGLDVDAALDTLAVTERAPKVADKPKKRRRKN